MPVASHRPSPLASRAATALAQHKQARRAHDAQARRAIGARLHIDLLPHARPLGRLPAQLPPKQAEDGLDEGHADAVVVEHLPRRMQLHRERTERDLVDEASLVLDDLRHLADEGPDLAIGAAFGRRVQQVVGACQRDASLCRHGRRALQRCCGILHRLLRRLRCQHSHRAGSSARLKQRSCRGAGGWRACAPCEARWAK
mmetsp:Transcript_2876/g.9081  ORF Transcript_2876/g.9081 Transcript_2876/m.9081 type:complete len:200 (+) Transcript_2876:86-685(+)